MIDQHFPALVILEMNPVPRLLQQLERLLNGLNPHRTRMRGQERRGAIGASSRNNIRGVRGASIGFASQNCARYYHCAMRV